MGMKKSLFVISTHAQYSQKLNVSYGMLNNKLIRPFFIDDNLTANKYLGMLQHQ